MDAIRKYAERTTLTQDIREGSTRVGLYSRGRNCGHCCAGWGARCGGGRVNGLQKHKCTYYKTDNHTSKECGQRKHAKSDTNASRNDKRICYHCGHTGHFKAASIHFKRAQDQCSKVNKGTASASLATGGYCDPIWLAWKCNHTHCTLCPSSMGYRFRGISPYVQWPHQIQLNKETSLANSHWAGRW